MEREYNGILKYKMKVGFKIKSIWALKSMLGWDLKSIYRTLLTPGVNEHHGALKVPPQFTYGQVQTGLDFPVLSDPGVQIASFPHGFGSQIDPWDFTEKYAGLPTKVATSPI